jgi:hypothetical protein
MACAWKTKYRFRAPGFSFWRAVVTDWPTVLKFEKWRMENPVKDLWEVRFFFHLGGMFSTISGCSLRWGADAARGSHNSSVKAQDGSNEAPIVWRKDSKRRARFLDAREIMRILVILLEVGYGKKWVHSMWYKWNIERKLSVLPGRSKVVIWVKC